MFVMGLIIFVGILLCFIPGIYISVAFSLVIAVIFFENLSLGKAFERSMFLVREDWWFTLGVGFVISLLVGFVSYILLLPATILSMFLMINSTQGESCQWGIRSFYDSYNPWNICGIYTCMHAPYYIFALIP